MIMEIYQARQLVAENSRQRQMAEIAERADLETANHRSLPPISPQPRMEWGFHRRRQLVVKVERLNGGRASPPATSLRWLTSLIVRSLQGILLFRRCDRSNIGNFCP